eukprot:10083237-Alexandrium_andersonii.AAC.1
MRSQTIRKKGKDNYGSNESHYGMAQHTEQSKLVKTYSWTMRTSLREVSDITTNTVYYLSID